jgi:hypothetical protein
VTDDTSMSLALGEAILASGGSVDPLACAEAFDAWMRRKPVDIGNTVRRNLLTSGAPAFPSRRRPTTTPATVPRCACCRWPWPPSVNRQPPSAQPCRRRRTSPTTTSFPTRCASS